MTTKEFMDKQWELKNAGYSESEIASFFGKTIMEIRKIRSVIMAHRRLEMETEARKLLDEGMKISEIAKEMGVNESTVRLLIEGRKTLTYEEVVEDLKTLEPKAV